MTEGIEESLLGFVEGDCSPDEAAAIQAWIAADPRRGELLDEVRAVWRLTGSSTRQWVVAEARVRLLRSRGRHAAQGSAGFAGRPGPISQVAETNPKGTPGIARGRRGYHHYDQASRAAQSMITPLVALLLQNPVAPAPAATPPRAVRVWLGSPSPLARGAAVRVYVEAGQDGDLVVLHRRTDGRIEVLFPKNPSTDPFVRAGTYEIRGGDDRAAWVVAEPDGTGMVLAALSPDSLRFDEFVRAAAWDSAALVPTWSGADAAGSMSDIVQRMLGDGYFNYDLVTYSVAPPVYAQQDLTPQQQDLTQQETAPAYDAYPTCLNCTFIGEQLIIYERGFGRRRFQREPVREPRQPTSALALALGPRSTAGPQPLSPGSRFTSPRHAAGPVPIEPRARERATTPSAQSAGPRTHVPFTRFSAPAAERSTAAAFVARAGGLAPAHPEALGQAVTRSDFGVRERGGGTPAAAASRAPVRSRAVAVARTGAGTAPRVSHGVAMGRETWGGSQARAGIARAGVGVRQR